MTEPQLEMLMDAMPHMVWLASADGRCTAFNRKWIDYTGLPAEQSLSAGWLAQLHADDLARVTTQWSHALAHGESFEGECRIRRADGHHGWMLGRAVPQRDAMGYVIQWVGTFTDIDELKQAAVRLEENMLMNRIAGRVAHLGGWTIDLPERKLTWSDENCAIHDVPPGYVPTLQEGINYFLPEHRSIVIRHVEACAQHGTPYEFVLPKLTAKGRQIWVRSIGEAQRDADGNIVRLQGAFQDITEQKLAEERMRALEVQLTDTLESITDGFLLMDRDWNFRFVNGHAEHMLKLSRHDLLGKNFWEVFPLTLGTIVETEFRQAMATRRTAQFDNFYEPLDSWFSIHAYPTHAGLAVYFQNVTALRAQQDQLRLLETAVSRLNDIVVIMQAPDDGESTPRIVFVNDAFERHTGYTREEAVGNTPGFVWAPHSHRAERERIRAAMQKWQPVRGEVVVQTKSGQALWLEIDVTPIADPTGRYTHWVAVERDVSERRHQQQEILTLNSELEARVELRTAQLAAANKELESFAYSVSHDLRSPLNTVDGFSQLLLKLESEHISDKGKHYLNRIGVGVKHMGELIEGLLTLAHLSQEQIRSELVDLSAMARRIEASCRDRDPRREAQVEVHVQEGLQGRGDPRLLAAVLQNLIDNAWKFTSRQAAPRIEVGSQPGSDGVPVFYVRDNGAGFDMAFGGKLFGTFERLHSPGDFPGTGIGLATVKRVIERHGGRVWAESKVNQGATFYFTLAPARR
ncbi:PAS domain S-box protein [Polaromonas sp. YR568]|uniref:PAS domain-containing sensor histidine kinase n=1 Tax=Polaromonas sp. YR568 TaxID=1855301 RepID=UPI003137E5E8